MSNAVNDGGPAFPCPTDNEYGRDFGMSLRDYFAAQAMIGEIGAIGLEESDEDEIAARCYTMADAMLKVRMR